MCNLSYGIVQPMEVGQIQQMIQGTEFSSMSFNRVANPIFIARQSYSIVGFAYGQKGYGQDADLLTIQGVYLRHHIDDEQHANELVLAFINWAEKNLGVHSYRLGEFGQVQPINISHVIPPMTQEKPEENMPFEASDIDVDAPQFAYQ